MAVSSSFPQLGLEAAYLATPIIGGLSTAWPVSARFLLACTPEMELIHEAQIRQGLCSCVCGGDGDVRCAKMLGDGGFELC